MKIIHCSDLHLDADLRSRFDAQAAAERRGELMNTFRRLCLKAQEEGVRAILICGDLFDTDTPSASAVRAVEDLILTYKKILFFILRGNHDGRSVLFAARPKPDNLFLFEDGWTGRVVESAGARPVYVTGRELSAAPFTPPPLDPASINIVMLHGQVREGITASDPESLPLGVLRGAGIDYLALGHLHSYRSFALDERGTAAYSGCLEGRGFDECGPCGYVLIETDTPSGKVEGMFVPFASRCLYRAEADVTGCRNDAEVSVRISAALDASPAQDKDLVRLELTGALEYGCSVDPALLCREWEDGFHYFDCVDRTHPVVHSEDFLCDATLKGEFVRIVSAADGLDESERAQVLRCGLRALSGEKLFP